MIVLERLFVAQELAFHGGEGGFFKSHLWKVRRGRGRVEIPRGEDRSEVILSKTIRRRICWVVKRFFLVGNERRVKFVFDM